MAKETEPPVAQSGGKGLKSPTKSTGRKSKDTQLNRPARVHVIDVAFTNGDLVGSTRNSEDGYVG